MAETVTSITRSTAIKLINESIENFFTFYDSYCYDNKKDLSDEQKDLYDQMNEAMMIVKNDKNYRNDLKIMPLPDLTDLLLMCKKMVDINDLFTRFSYPKGKFVIVENKNDFIKIGGDMSSADFTIENCSEVDLKQIKYFLDRYSSVSNWEYSGHGTFIAKKNATLWELGGIYWSKLFELPENPDKIRIGDEIKLKKEVIDTIYEYATKDINGTYSFDSKEPEASDLIYSIISFGIGVSNTPKIVEGMFTGVDVGLTAADILSTEKYNSKLSYFIQQYSNEGAHEDGMRKFIEIASFLGPVFSALGLLSSASIDENKYQIVEYNQRKAFLNSALLEIERINTLKEKINEKNIQIEFEYLRFLQKQIIMLTEEIRLNDKADKQEVAKILSNFAQYNTHGVHYKDTRTEMSPDSYHQIDYYKLFKEQK